MEILDATPEDAEAIVQVVHAAFRPTAGLYDMESLPPLEDTPEGLVADLACQVVLKAVEDGRIVGSVRGEVADGTCKVGRLVVDPRYQGRGIGRALMREVERRCSGVRRFELFTGHLNAASLHLYTDLGYEPFRTERVSDTLQLIYLCKPCGGQGDGA